MANPCKYTYYDSDGNLSEEYYNNEDTYGSGIARAMFIVKALQTDLVRFSTAIDVVTKLKERKSHEDLSKLGYIGVTSVVNDSKSKAVNKELIEANMAINLKLGTEGFSTRQTVIDYFKYDNESGTATDNISEFQSLKVDARTYLDILNNKGTEVHKLMQYVSEAHNKANDKLKYLVRDVYKEGANLYRENSTSDKRLTDDNISKLENGITKVLDLVNSLNKNVDNNPNHVADFSLFTEVSLYSDNVTYKGKPLQGHVDIMIYSPSRNVAHIIDVKTKTNKSYLGFEKAYGTKSGAFSHMPDSTENDVVIQTGAYAILAKQQLGINVLSTQVMLISSEYASDGNTVGNRTWDIKNVDTTELRDLYIESNMGALHSVLGIKEPKIIGEKSSEDLINELYDNKLITVASSKDNFVNAQLGFVIKVNDKLQWNHPYDRQIKVLKDTEDEIKEAIAKAYDKFIENKKRAPKDLIHFFKEGVFPQESVWLSKAMTNKANTLLKRFKKETHTLESGSSVLSSIGDDVIIVTDKTTKKVTLISIAMTYDDAYHFNDTTDEDASTTILGPFMSDKSVYIKYGRTVIPQATAQTLSQIKLAMLAAELKTVNPTKYANIVDILSTTLLEEGSDAYGNVDMRAVRGWLTEIYNVMRANGRIIPQELDVIVNDTTLNKPSSLETDHFESFIQSVVAYSDPLRQYLSQHPKTPKADTLLKDLRESIDIYIKDKNDLNVYQKLSDLMGKYVQTVYGRLMTELKSKEAVFAHPIFIAANQAFLSFKNLMVAEDPTFRGHVLGQINSLTTVGNPVAEKVHIAITQSEQQARDKILLQIREHERLQTKLMKETSGINIAVSIFDPTNFKKVFGPMLVDGYEFDEKNVENWMKFKDPDQLTGTQKEYVIFYNKLVEASMTTLFGKTKKDIMFPDADSKFANDVVKKWKRGYIPILPKSASVDFKKLSLTRQGLDSSLEIIKNLLFRGKKSSMDESSEELNPWEFSSFFPDQVDSSPGRGSKRTRHYLGITSDNKVISSKRSIELNPAVILNALIVEAARKEHMTAAAFAAFAVQAELSYKNSYPGMDTKALRDLIGNIVNIRIHGKVKDEGKFADVVDVAKNMTGIGMFFGSFRQFFTEGGTAALQLTSQSVANFFNKYLFKGTNAYDNKDMAWAAKHVMSDFGKDIIDFYGMYHAGLMEFTSDDFIATKSKLLYQTKHGFAMIQAVLRQSVQAIVLAQMHKSGITEKAFKRDANGILVYDETKDDRFYVYDPDLKLENQKKSAPTSQEDTAKHELWKAHRRQLLKEGGIDVETHKITRPFIIEELQSFKNQAVRLVGAMDNSEALGIEYVALGRAAAAYKKWIRQKIANYWTPKSKSFKMGAWKEIEGELKYVYEDFEGILNTVFSLAKDIREIGFSATFSGMTNIQRRNLSKLMADLLLTAAFTLILLELFKELFDDQLIGQELNRGLSNAASDIFPLLAVINTIKGSPMAAISITIDVAKNTTRTLFYLVTGDLDKASTAADKMFDFFGAYRAGKSMAELIIES